jgi:RNA 3'-terminal phosphate cyclase (ATP)
MPCHAATSKSKPASQASSDSASPIPSRVLRTPGLVSLDGRTLEGGGQLVRLALTFSALLSIPLHVHHIRGNRASRKAVGGLKSSHLAALEVLARECGAEVYGGTVGSNEVVFLPRRGSGSEEREEGVKKVLVELSTPGSVWLVWQAVFPFLIFRSTNGKAGISGPPKTKPENGEKDSAPEEDVVELTLRGGTNVTMSMSAEYVTQVFLHVAAKLGFPPCNIEVKKRGWTHGHMEIGDVVVRIMLLKPGQCLRGFHVDGQGHVVKVAVSVLAGSEVLDVLVAASELEIRAHFPGVEVEVVVKEDSRDPRRMYLLLVAHTSTGWRLGRDWLFDGKIKVGNAKVIGEVAERMAQKVSKELADEIASGACVDEFMQDQLVVFQALAEGKSFVDAGLGEVGEESSLHTKTVRWVVEEMLGGRVKINGSSIQGIGLRAGEDFETSPDSALKTNGLVKGKL